MNTFLIAFFYTNTEVLIPRLLARRRWLWYSLIIIAALLLFIQLPRLFEDAIKAALPPDIKERIAKRKRGGGGFSIFNGYTAVFFLVFTISTSMKVIQQWLNADKKRREIETDKLSTELSFLRTQINPHFLFNTLNNIYSLAVVKSDATPIAVLKLSSIMRYVLSETKNDWVPLDNEIRFIQDYIELQKMRLTDKVSISFTITGNTGNKTIAPLLLIPFVENAFKYGISTKEESAISIRLNVDDQQIGFVVNNNIVATEIERTDKNGIGLANVKRRLELLYPSDHTLQIGKHDNVYSVKLVLTK